jgi:hypothetical protein
VDALKDTLKVYCEGSGQKINLEKSSVFFGRHCMDQVTTRVKDRLEVQSETLNDFYLGMPTSVGRSPTATFKFIMDKIWKYVNGLSGRPASRAGIETLLKMVVQAIPNFIMSCFELPLLTCDAIRSLIANLWWGVEDGKKRYIGDLGTGYQHQRVLVAWAFVTFLYLIKPCSLSKGGVC